MLAYFGPLMIENTMPWSSSGASSLEVCIHRKPTSPRIVTANSNVTGR